MKYLREDDLSLVDDLNETNLNTEKKHSHCIVILVPREYLDDLAASVREGNDLLSEHVYPNNVLVISRRRSISNRSYCYVAASVRREQRRFGRRVDPTLGLADSLDFLKATVTNELKCEKD